MSDRAEQLLHVLIGVGIAGANYGILHAFGVLELRLWIALSVWWSLVVAFTRESEQARAKRIEAAKHGKKLPRPSNVFAWSVHRWEEFLAVPAGALTAIGAYAVF